MSTSNLFLNTVIEKILRSFETLWALTSVKYNRPSHRVSGQLKDRIWDFRVKGPDLNSWWGMIYHLQKWHRPRVPTFLDELAKI